MKSTIIAISGRKGAGKDTISSFISEWWSQQPNFDPRHPDILGDCSIEAFSFADLLKRFCIEALGLRREQCYGSDAEKETPTKYSWNKTPMGKHKWLKTLYELSKGYKARQGPMTAREVMQVFGTECVRTWFGNVWAEATIRKIEQNNPNLALITDARFPNEVETILDYSKGYVIRLTRSPFGTKDQHASEASLDGYDWNKEKCFVLDNSKMSIAEQNEAVVSILEEIVGVSNEPN